MGKTLCFWLSIYAIGFLALFFSGIHGERKDHSVDLRSLVLLILLCFGWPVCIIPYGIWFIQEHGDQIKVFESYKEAKRLKALKRGFDN